MAAVLQLQPAGRETYIAAALECIPRDAVEQTWPIELLLVYFAELVPLGSLVEPGERRILEALVLERKVAAGRPFSRRHCVPCSLVTPTNLHARTCAD